jgi:hypothetical protein
MALVTIRSFEYPLEVTLLKGMLEEVGIPVYIKDEFTILMNPLYSNAIGGIKVQVLEEDVEKAMQVLQDFEATQNNPI